MTQLKYGIIGLTLTARVINRKSRMKGDFHVRLCENLRVKLRWVNRLAVSGFRPDLATYFIDKKL